MSRCAGAIGIDAEVRASPAILEMNASGEGPCGAFAAGGATTTTPPAPSLEQVQVEAG